MSFMRLRGAAIAATTFISIALSATSAVAAGVDFAKRCADPAVVRCIGFDDPTDFNTGSGTDGAHGDNFGILPPEGTSDYTRVTRDTAIRASGRSSLKFTIPSNSGSDSSGAFFANFSKDLSVTFGSKNTFYVQWRQRFSPEFINTRFMNEDGEDANGWKQIILGTGDSIGKQPTDSCTALDLVAQNYYNAGLPVVYHSCTGSASHGPHDPFFKRVGQIDFKLQNKRPSPYCLNSQGPDNYFKPDGNCFGYVPNEWITFQMRVQTGKRVGDQFVDSYITLWAARDGKASQELLYWGPYKLSAGPAGDGQRFGKVWLLPFNTEKSAGQAHPTAYTWYDELIISKKKIADPTLAAKEVPVPPPPPEPPQPPEPPSPPEPPQPALDCPAYPAFPDANCTGWQHTGVNLTPYTGPMTITTPGTVLDSKLITGTLTINANNVTVKRSQVNGVVRLLGSIRTGVLVEDVYIDGQNTSNGSECIGGAPGSNGGVNAAGFVMRRLNIMGCTQGVYGRGFTLEDSYIHDLYAAGADHTEPILGFTGDIVIRHNRLVANYRASKCTGACGMSAVIALYSHSSFWGDIDGVVVEQNWLESFNPGKAGYCLYGGNSPDNTGNAKNTIYRDNVFARSSTNKCGEYGPVVYLPTGGNNCWSNNRFSDGVAITSALPACSASAPQLTGLPIKGGIAGQPGATGWQHAVARLNACEAFLKGEQYVLDGRSAPLTVDSCDFGRGVKIYGNVTLKRSRVLSSASVDCASPAIRIESGAGPVLIEDVEITTTNPNVVGGGARLDRTICVMKDNTQPVTLRRLWTHDSIRGLDITGQQNIVVEDSYLGPNVSPPTGKAPGVCTNNTERAHASAVRAAGGTRNIVFRNTVLHIGACSWASGLIATYPENGANSGWEVAGGRWIIEGENSGAYGIAMGFTPPEQQNTNYNIHDLQISTQFYSDGCPSGCAQSWEELGGTKAWTNVRKFNPGRPDDGELILP